MNVRFAEITAVQDEADMLISVSFCLVQHELKLRHVNYAAGVCLVKERLFIIPVKSDRIIEYRLVRAFF